jgi:ABC-type Mn2+/Zn2+ transport system ATPase subunit
MHTEACQPADLALEVRDLWVTLGNTRVLRGVNLHVPKGQLVALIGPNGSGKTTLLRCLLGLQPVEQGEVRLLGHPPGPDVLKRIGYVPQRLQLDRSFILSVREFLALRRKSTQRWFWHSKHDTDQHLQDILVELGAEHLLDRPIAGLSGGQLQRVLIAFSLLSNPEVLLLDEPTAGVDSPGEHTFYEMIAEIHRRRQITVMLVSHDLGMVFRHAAWVYALNGVICCEGEPEHVMNAESLKEAYGIHVAPYQHQHHAHHPHAHPHSHSHPLSPSQPPHPGNTAQVSASPSTQPAEPAQSTRSTPPHAH